MVTQSASHTRHYLLTTFKTQCLRDPQAFILAALPLDARERTFSVVNRVQRDVDGFALPMMGSNWQRLGHSLGPLF